MVPRFLSVTPNIKLCKSTKKCPQPTLHVAGLLYGRHRQATGSSQVSCSPRGGKRRGTAAAKNVFRPIPCLPQGEPCPQELGPLRQGLRMSKQTALQPPINVQSRMTMESDKGRTAAPMTPMLAVAIPPMLLPCVRQGRRAQRRSSGVLSCRRSRLHRFTNYTPSQCLFLAICA